MGRRLRGTGMAEKEEVGTIVEVESLVSLVLVVGETIGLALLAKKTQHSGRNHTRWWIGPAF